MSTLSKWENWPCLFCPLVAQWVVNPVYLSYYIFITRFPSVSAQLPPSKAHTSPEPHVHSDHYCVDYAVYWIKRCWIFPTMQCRNAWASPSLSLVVLQIVSPPYYPLDLLSKTRCVPICHRVHLSLLFWHRIKVSKWRFQVFFLEKLFWSGG